MSDWSKNKEAQESPRESPPGKLSPRGVSSMRGSDAAAESRESLPDCSYTDAQGRDLTMRTYHSGDSYMVRVFDKAKTPQPPDTPSFGDAGRANLHLERDAEGRIDRARLQDIDTTPSYRGAGTGGRMLEQCELIARQNGAREIYGTFSAETGKVDETRQFYGRRGFAFTDDGRQISKALEAWKK